MNLAIFIILALAGLIVIAAGVTRCSRCGQWHESQEAQDECRNRKPRKTPSNP